MISNDDLDNVAGWLREHHRPGLAEQVLAAFGQRPYVAESEVVAAADGRPLLERMQLLLDHQDLTFAECSLAEEWMRAMREAFEALSGSTDTEAAFQEGVAKGMFRGLSAPVSDLGITAIEDEGKTK